MVELGEGVDEQLPVALDLGAVLVDLRQLAERVALEATAELAEVLAQRRLVLPVEVHEDEPLPHVAFDRHEAEVALVEVEELVLLLDERERAFEVVPPTVVLARELPAHALRLLAREVVPDELVAPVAADVVERPDAIAGGAHDDDRGAEHVDLLREVAPELRHLLDSPDVQPGPAEDRLPLELVERR